jgi:adenine-specific DNA-methyltransferase
VRKEQLGQYFTVDERVQAAMVKLVKHRTGHALEPSAGAGHLASALASARPSLDIDCVEVDKTLPWNGPGSPECAEFMTWSQGRSGQYDVVFGNPPYVSVRALSPTMQRTLAQDLTNWHGKANLYHLFIHRSAQLLSDGGELVFIVPTDWMYQTATASLRAELATLGSVTHVINLGEEKVFPDADVPALCIFRFQRGSRSRTVRYRTGLSGKWENRRLHTTENRWFFLDTATAELTRDWRPLGEQYVPRVGMVTGLDAAFSTRPNAVERRATRMLLTTTRTEAAFIDANRFACIDDVPRRAREHLLAHKHQLLERRIRAFDESNWWQWGAIRNLGEMASGTERFYALAKTRSPEPFFTHTGSGFYSAGVVGLFKLPGAMQMDAAVNAANSAAFRSVLEGMQLVTNDKVQLQPSTLADALFPTTADEASALERYRLPA